MGLGACAPWIRREGRSYHVAEGIPRVREHMMAASTAWIRMSATKSSAMRRSSVAHRRIFSSSPHLGRALFSYHRHRRRQISRTSALPHPLTAPTPTSKPPPTFFPTSTPTSATLRRAPRASPTRPPVLGHARSEPSLHTLSALVTACAPVGGCSVCAAESGEGVFFVAGCEGWRDGVARS